MSKSNIEQTQPTQSLSSLATIRTGYTFREKMAEQCDGDLPVVQIKDVRQGPGVNLHNLPRIQASTVRDGPNVHSNDILLPARGDYCHAALWPHQEPALATSQLFVLTAKSPAISPAYLCWYLNQPTAQYYFSTHRSGSNMPMLNKHSLGALKVRVPTQKTQATITAVERCWQREKQVMQQLQSNRERMLQSIFRKLLEP